jgi:hypothetical protein
MRRRHEDGGGIDVDQAPSLGAVKRTDVDAATGRFRHEVEIVTAVRQKLREPVALTTVGSRYDSHRSARGGHPHDRAVRYHREENHAFTTPGAAGGNRHSGDRAQCTAVDVDLG